MSELDVQVKGYCEIIGFPWLLYFVIQLNHALTQNLSNSLETRHSLTSYFILELNAQPL